MRASVGDVVTAAGLHSLPLDALVEVVAAVLQPPAAEAAPDVVRVATTLANGMEKAGTPGAEAALDAVTAVVCSGHPVMAGGDEGRSAAAAALWTVPTRLGAAMLAQQLASGAARLLAMVGPGVVGAHDVYESGSAGRDLQDSYLASASAYIDWQQHAECHCLGQETAQHRSRAPRHHLREWRPGQFAADGKPIDAPNLALWFRTWVIGQQEADDRFTSGGTRALLPKALEAGLLYRHFLPHLPSASMSLVIDDVLEERCAAEHCPGAGKRAHRYTSQDHVPRYLFGSRRCLVDASHPLDFTRPRSSRAREMIVVSRDGLRASHRRFRRLGWNAHEYRWEFVATDGVTRWLPLPHGEAFRRLLSRGAAVSKGWTQPVVAWRADSRDREEPPSSSAPSVDRETALVLDEGLSAAIRHVLAQPSMTGLQVLDNLVDLLRPTGRIKVDPWCSCCTVTGHSQSHEESLVLNAERDYCATKLEDIVLRVFETSASIGKVRP